MSQPQLIDIGANLTHESFAHDRPEVLAAARAAGVTRLIVTGASVDGAHQAAALAAQHPGELFATAGVHPHHAKDWTATDGAALRALLVQPQVVAAGECGLDYFRNFSSPDQQRDVFRQQLELAAELKLPVFLHQRDAHADFLAILDDYHAQLPRAVAHCFTGTEDELRAYLERDLYIGITGWICDERRGHHLRELIALIPPERLMIETDAPYLMPRDLKPRPAGRRNEPKFLPHILAAVATAAGRSVGEVARQTTRAAETFFDLP